MSYSHDIEANSKALISLQQQFEILKNGFNRKIEIFEDVLEGRCEPWITKEESRTQEKIRALEVDLRNRLTDQARYIDGELEKLKDRISQEEERMTALERKVTDLEQKGNKMLPWHSAPMVTRIGRE